MGLDWQVMNKDDGTTPMDTLGAKRLNRNDPETVAQYKELLGDSPENYEEDEGKYLPPPAANLPPTSPGSIFAGRLSWRGKRLQYVDGLDEDLLGRAFQDFTPEEALEYANRLEADKPDDEDVKEAVVYLRFWGEKGHGIHAWY